MRPFSTEVERQQRRDLISHLQNVSPAQLMAESERLTLVAFQRQIREVPAYREMLAEFDPATVSDIGAFRKLAPILDKHNTFGARDIRDLCRGGDLDGVRSILTSSGHSGVFSFGVNTEENLARSSRSIDVGLEYIFGVDERSTLLINALPMGVKVNTKAAVLAETSVREDMVFALIKKFASEFEQIIIVAEGSFAKKIVEDGADHHGIDWRELPVSLITGEEGIAENYRSYMAHRLGISDPARRDGKLVMSSMGIAELDLNIFHETLDTIRIRRLAHQDPKLRRALFGDASSICPMLFVYYPTRCYIEQHPSGNAEQELVLSMLSDEMKIPLLRYRTGDLGRIFQYEDMVRILREHGYSVAPDLKLPFVAVYGRGEALTSASSQLTPDEVKEAIYADYEIAELLTGNFGLKMKAGNLVEIEFQLRKGKEPPAGVEARFSESLAKINPIEVKPIFIAYQSFPHMMEIDWERKFRYLDKKARA